MLDPVTRRGTPRVESVPHGALHGHKLSPSKQKTREKNSRGGGGGGKNQSEGEKSTEINAVDGTF